MNCPKCGNALSANTAFCEHCGNTVTPPATEPVQKPENVLTGTVGALLGAALGAGAIILLSRLGFVASVSGLILAVCTLKGYELLGGRLSAKGIIISILLILITPYLANRLDWAIFVSQEDPAFTLADAFRMLPDLLEIGFIKADSYWTNLLMVYGFAALGAFSTLKNIIKSKKN